MSLLAMHVPSLEIGVPFNPTPQLATAPNVIKTRVQTIMDDIHAPVSPRDNNWNYVACSPLRGLPAHSYFG